MFLFLSILKTETVRVSQSPWITSGSLCESHRPQQMHHDQVNCCKAGHLAEDWEKGRKIQGWVAECDTENILLALVSLHHSPTWMLHRSSSRLLQEVEQSCASGLSRKKDVIQSFTGLFEVRKEWISESNRMLPVPHFPEQPFSLDNHKYKYCQITPRSWPDAPNVFTENESFRHRPVSKNRTPEVLGSAPVLSWRERL